MSEATRAGLVTDLQAVPEGKNKTKAKVGGRSVGVWVKGYQSDDESEAYLALKAAFDQGVPVTVYGKEEEYTPPNSRSSITMFTAQNVVFDNAAGNGHQQPATSPSPVPGATQTSPPSVSDPRFLVFAEWCFGRQMDKLPEGTQLTDEVMAVMKVDAYVLASACWELATQWEQEQGRPKDAAEEAPF